MADANDIEHAETTDSPETHQSGTEVNFETEVICPGRFMSAETISEFPFSSSDIQYCKVFKKIRASSSGNSTELLESPAPSDDEVSSSDQSEEICNTSASAEPKILDENQCTQITDNIDTSKPNIGVCVRVDTKQPVGEFRENFQDLENQDKVVQNNIENSQPAEESSPVHDPDVRQVENFFKGDTSTKVSQDTESDSTEAFSDTESLYESENRSPAPLCKDPVTQTSLPPFPIMIPSSFEKMNSQESSSCDKEADVILKNSSSSSWSSSFEFQLHDARSRFLNTNQIIENEILTENIVHSNEISEKKEVVEKQLGLQEIASIIAPPSASTAPSTEKISVPTINAYFDSILGQEEEFRSAIVDFETDDEYGQYGEHLRSDVSSIHAIEFDGSGTPDIFTVHEGDSASLRPEVIPDKKTNGVRMDSEDQEPQLAAEDEAKLLDEGETESVRDGAEDLATENAADLATKDKVDLTTEDEADLTTEDEADLTTEDEADLSTEDETELDSETEPEAEFFEASEIEPEYFSDQIANYKVDYFDCEIDTSKASSDSDIETSPNPYRMLYIPIYRRGDGNMTLLLLTDYLLARKWIDKNGASTFVIKIPLRNISNHSVTFRIRTCDESKYEINPQFGVLQSGERIEAQIHTIEPNEWSYVDLHHDSVQIMAASFYTCGDLHKSSDNGFDEKILAIGKFWNKFTTKEFPYAEEYLVRHIMPCDVKYLNEPSLNQTAFERFVKKNRICFPFFKPKKYEIDRKLSSKNSEMLFGDFSKDPGVLFIRDQARAILVNRDRFMQIHIGRNVALKNLLFWAIICSVVFLAFWFPFSFRVINSYKATNHAEIKETRNYFLSFFNFWPFSYFYKT